jgi:hypothetical protein
MNRLVKEFCWAITLTVGFVLVAILFDDAVKRDQSRSRIGSTDDPDIGVAMYTNAWSRRSYLSLESNLPARNVEGSSPFFDERVIDEVSFERISWLGTRFDSEAPRGEIGVLDWPMPRLRGRETARSFEAYRGKVLFGFPFPSYGYEASAYEATRLSSDASDRLYLATTDEGLAPGVRAKYKAEYERYEERPHGPVYQREWGQIGFGFPLSLVFWFTVVVACRRAFWRVAKRADSTVPLRPE